MNGKHEDGIAIKIAVLRRVVLYERKCQSKYKEFMVDDRMKFREDICTRELEYGHKSEKSTNENGITSQYLKARNDVSREELRVMLNDVMNGGDIP